MFEFKDISESGINDPHTQGLFKSLLELAKQEYDADYLHTNSTNLFLETFKYIDWLARSEATKELVQTPTIAQLRCYLYYHQAQKMITETNTQDLYMDDAANQQFFSSFYLSHYRSEITSPTAINAAQTYFQAQQSKINLLAPIITALETAYEFTQKPESSIPANEKLALAKMLAEYKMQLADTHFDFAAAMRNEHLRSGIGKDQFKKLKRGSSPVIDKINHYFVRAYENIFHQNNNNYQAGKVILEHYQTARLLTEEAYAIYYQAGPDEEEVATYGRICFTLYKECQTIDKTNLLSSHGTEFNSSLDRLKNFAPMLPDEAHIKIYENRFQRFEHSLAMLSVEDVMTESDDENISKAKQTKNDEGMETEIIDIESNSDNETAPSYQI